MRSTWLCSRNDLIANAAVLVAAALVAQTASRWPDVVVGLTIAVRFFQTAIGVLRDATAQLRRTSTTVHTVHQS
jgi:Co/Zn/Cd efflux system component